MNRKSLDNSLCVEILDYLPRLEDEPDDSLIDLVLCFTYVTCQAIWLLPNQEKPSYCKIPNRHHFFLYTNIISICSKNLLVVFLTPLPPSKSTSHFFLRFVGKSLYEGKTNSLCR